MSDRLSEYENHPKWKKFLYAAAFVCLMLAGFLMVFSLRSKAETQKQSDFSTPCEVVSIELAEGADSIAADI